ncbi:MAG: nucleoside hydrolase, partial [Clostridia bacterium]|nr:nucleoside hydrolase [Clostridia bacterium]
MNDFEKRLLPPSGPIDVVLDTDTFNEIDDQFALSYMLSYKERLNVKAIYAAPFFNTHSTGPEDGMIRSYNEILTLLDLSERKELK